MAKKNTLKVKFKKLHPDAVIPKYAKSGDAGLDLTAVSIEDKFFQLGYIEYDTGIALEIPAGYVGLLFPRSSVTNKDLMLKNSVGVLDSSYRNSIKFRFYPFLRNNNWYKAGDRVGQLVILPYPQIELEEVSELSSSERDLGGFGSTGT